MGLLEQEKTNGLLLSLWARKSYANSLFQNRYSEKSEWGKNLLNHETSLLPNMEYFPYRAHSIICPKSF